MGGGRRQCILNTSDAARTRLVHLPAGGFVPEHGHRGLELMLVVSGTIAEGDRIYGPGDVTVADESVRHEPTASRNGPAFCLIATDAPLRYSRWGARAMQPFTRF